MKILDLFAGLGGEERRAKIEAMGHSLDTLDIDPLFGCSITADVMHLDDDLGLYDFIWASPPCEAFSVASIGTHWTGGKNAYIPRTEQARKSIALVEHTLFLCLRCAKYGFVIENPRGVLRKMPFMKDIRRYTTTYCQYGETRMKPTDLWVCGLNWQPRPACKNGDPCHERAPRGAKTGTQGIKGAAERAVVPWPLWEEVIHAAESAMHDLQNAEQTHWAAAEYPKVDGGAE